MEETVKTKSIRVKCLIFTGSGSDVLNQFDTGETVIYKVVNEIKALENRIARYSKDEANLYPMFRIHRVPRSDVNGSVGNLTALFIVERSGVMYVPASVTWTLSGYGAAPAGTADFGGTYPSGVLSFGAGESIKYIKVTAATDVLIEPTEDFIITLSNPGTAVIKVGTAIGHIFKDTL